MCDHQGIITHVFSKNKIKSTDATVSAFLALAKANKPKARILNVFWQVRAYIGTYHIQNCHVFHLLSKVT